MPALSECLSPSEVSSVTYAVLMANSRSAAGCLTFVRPRIVSSSPNGQLRGGRGALELSLVLLEAGDARFHRRVRHEQRGHGLLDARRNDEEGVHAAHLAQVLIGHPLHRA